MRIGIVVAGEMSGVLKKKSRRRMGIIGSYFKGIFLGLILLEMYLVRGAFTYPAFALSNRFFCLVDSPINYVYSQAITRFQLYANDPRIHVANSGCGEETFLLQFFFFLKCKTPHYTHTRAKISANKHLRLQLPYLS